jgi:hypothetical protein
VLLAAVPVTDPAWFYSSLAQAAAAIIGLLGAILLAQLLRHADDMAKSRNELVTRFRAQRSFGKERRAWAEEYKGFLQERIAALQAQEAQGIGALAIHKEMSWSSRSGGSLGSITVNQAMIDGATENLTYCDPVFGAFGPVTESESVNDSAKLAKGLRDASAEWGDPPRGFTESAADTLEAIGADARLHNRRALSARVWLLLVVLAWLAIVGVIAPLGWLVVTDAAGTQKVLLTLFAVGIVGLFIYLGDTLLSVRRANSLKLTKDELA